MCRTRFTALDDTHTHKTASAKLRLRQCQSGGDGGGGCQVVTLERNTYRSQVFANHCLLIRHDTFHERSEGTSQTRLASGSSRPGKTGDHEIHCALRARAVPSSVLCERKLSSTRKKHATRMPFVIYDMTCSTGFSHDLSPGCTTARGIDSARIGSYARSSEYWRRTPWNVHRLNGLGTVLGDMQQNQYSPNALHLSLAYSLARSPDWSDLPDGYARANAAPEYRHM